MELRLIRSQDHNIIKRYDTGVILHLYYPDMWNDLLPYLLNLGKQFDLFVTIPYDVDISENTIKENFSNVQIYHCENRGRDIAPFLVVFSAIAPLGYKYICKIHTKKSPHIASGIEWQQDMLCKLLGSRKIISRIKKAFDEHPDWGLIAPQGHVAPYNYYWGQNATNVLKLAHSVGIPTDNIEFSFVAGSMFWFRPQAFDLLLETGILTQDFDLERGKQDGTLAHAFERFFGMAANHAGYKIAESDLREVKLSDISLQFRLLIQTSQNQEQNLTAQLMEKGRSVQALTVQAAALMAQLAEKEQAVAALTAQVAEKEQVVAGLMAQVAEIHGSRAWRLIQVLWKIRTAITPHGSRRERWLYLAVRAASYFKHYGLRSFIRRAVEKLKHKGVTSLISPQPDPFAVIAQDGRPCPMPAISIVIEKNPELNLPSVNEADVLAWVSAQTLRGIEVAVWESDTDKAFTLGESVRTWDAPGLEGLCGGLAGRYLCMASPDLLQRNRAYLETNLIELESEGLAFTVNALGKSDWLLAPLVRNHLPGDRRLPYLRQMILKDCARNNFSLDITSWFIERQDMPTVAGKIIVHTTAFPDADNPFPVETLLAETVEWSLKGNYILARSSSQIPWEPLTHVVHPVNTVIPVAPEPSNLPTIIIIMPFLAVGGAERVALDVVRGLKDAVRFIVVGIEPFDPALGTTADAFRQTTPYVYIASDYIAQPLSFSFLQYLIERFRPVTFYVANGSPVIYEALIKVKHFYPQLRIANQVYDHIAGWINLYDTELVAHVDVNIGCNHRIGQAYVEHGVSLQKSLVIENGVDVSEFDPALYSVDQVRALKDRFGLPQNKRVITFLSRFHPQKRPMDFVELARRYVNDASVIFFMVGDGPLASTVDSEIASIGLTNLVRLPFYRPSIDIFAVSDVIVLPSEYEGMPMVILEAQAMGKPVVVTDVGNNREVLDVTGGGRVVASVGDVTALRAELQLILNAPPNFLKVRQAIVEHFSLQRMVEKYRRALLEGRLDA